VNETKKGSAEKNIKKWNIFIQGITSTCRVAILFLSWEKGS